MRAIKSLTLSYVPKQDRVLAAINPGDPDEWSCWLTRRLVQAVLGRSPEFVESTSTLVKQVPPEVRNEVRNFEREAAMVSTAKAMSKTPAEVLERSASEAELAERLTIANQTNHFRIEMRGEMGEGAIGLFGRAEIQRVLQMLQAEVEKAGWFTATAKSSAASTTDVASPMQFVIS